MRPVFSDTIYVNDDHKRVEFLFREVSQVDNVLNNLKFASL